MSTKMSFEIQVYLVMNDQAQLHDTLKVKAEIPAIAQAKEEMRKLSELLSIKNYYYLEPERLNKLLPHHPNVIHSWILYEETIYAICNVVSIQPRKGGIPNKSLIEKSAV
jgi:hypothetical protein